MLSTILYSICSCNLYIWKQLTYRTFMVQKSYSKNMTKRRIMFVTNLCRHGIRIRNEGYLCFVVGWFSSTPHPQWQPTKAKTLPATQREERPGERKGRQPLSFGIEGRGADTFNKMWSSVLFLFLSRKGSEVQPFVQWAERCSNAFSHVMQRRRQGGG